MCARLLACFVVLGSCALALPAHAQLEDARRAYGDLNYEACRSAASTALAEPGVVSERVETYKLLGLCQAALGDTEEARSSFMKMLAIKPDATLPPGLSPRFTSSFLEAKGEWVGKNPLGLELFGEKAEGKTRIIRLIVRDDAELVARVVWQDEDNERGAELVAAEKMELEVPMGLDITLLALDKAGGVVAQLPIGTGVAEEKPDPEPTEETAGTTGGGEEGEGDGPPWLLIGAGVAASVLVAAGGAAAVGLYLAQPSTVTLESQVAFGNQ